jgi:hypothetical protein
LIDSAGADHGMWRVQGASNRDWEAIASGPCRGAGDAWCLYIGDTGDNDAERESVSIYRVPEPNDSQPVLTAPAERLRVSYPTGAVDVEAIYVTPNGAVELITKRRMRDQSNRPRPALVYELPPSAWSDSAPVVAQLIDSLPIIPGSATGRTITDASLSPSGRYVAVRTYAQIYVFTVDSTSGRIDTHVAPAICNLWVLDAGEGITWRDGAGTFLLTNEGEHAPIYRLKCRV